MRRTSFKCLNWRSLIIEFGQIKKPWNLSYLKLSEPSYLISVLFQDKIWSIIYAKQYLICIESFVCNRYFWIWLDISFDSSASDNSIKHQFSTNRLICRNFLILTMYLLHFRLLSIIHFSFQKSLMHCIIISRWSWSKLVVIYYSGTCIETFKSLQQTRLSKVCKI